MLKLPFKTVISGNIEVVIDRISRCHIAEAIHMFEEAIDTGSGLGLDEFGTKAELTHRLHSEAEAPPGHR